MLARLDVQKRRVVHYESDYHGLWTGSARRFLPVRSLKYLLLAFFLFVVFTMTAEELGGFLVSPFGIVADVKMLNFFQSHRCGGNRGDCGTDRAVGVDPEFLVPLSLPIRSTDGHCLRSQPGQNSPRRSSLHRLREVQQGLSIASPSGQAGANPVGRVYWVHGVHCSVPRGERTASLARATQVAHLRWPAGRSCCSSMVASRTQSKGCCRVAGTCVSLD